MVNFSIGGTMGLFAPSKKDKKSYVQKKKIKDKKSYVQKKIFF